PAPPLPPETPAARPPRGADCAGRAPAAGTVQLALRRAPRVVVASGGGQRQREPRADRVEGTHHLPALLGALGLGEVGERLLEAALGEPQAAPGEQQPRPPVVVGKRPGPAFPTQL